MSIEEFAAFTSASGTKILRDGGRYWRRVRPFFYRPLLIHEESDPRDTAMPWAARLGGIQHAVRCADPHNSTMWSIVSEPASQYSLATLGKKDAWAVRTARKRFCIRRVFSNAEIDQSAHAAYLEFYLRTRYSFRAERRDPARFRAWMETAFRFPKILVLVAQEGKTIQAISIFQWVEDTLHYTSFFASDEAIRHHVSDLMLHTVRSVAAATSGVKRVLAITAKDHLGLNSFYLFRGFNLTRQPACLRLNPLAAVALRLFSPREYARLQGCRPPQIPRRDREPQ